MPNPYQSKGPNQFWRTAVAEVSGADVEPLPSKRFRIDEHSVIATFGSCFAQNLARELRTSGWGTFLQTEPVAADQPLFSALCGNVYTVRQLLQLFEEAFGRRLSLQDAWPRPDGSFVDPKRPTVFAAGFPTPSQVLDARKCHLAAVRRAFSECNVLVFTLGLTEHWHATCDGSVVTVAPGVINPQHSQEGYAFGNFTYADTVADLSVFIERLHEVNPGARIILTVSPVPLTATYTDEHVLVATFHSKAILRAACSFIETAHDPVFYFPSYEIITGSHARGDYFDSNRRTVTSEGVAHVMRVFAKSYCQRRASPLVDPEKVICDEEEIAKSIGF